MIGRTRAGLLLAAVAALALLLSSHSVTHADPIFTYSLPQSWGGLPDTTVDDLSPAGNDANTAGTPALSATIPPGADPATQSLDSHGGGFQTAATGLLNNNTLAAAGGFVFNVSFLWDGGTHTFPVQKVIDYAGTESLQIGDLDPANGTANLYFRFNDDDASQISLPIMADQWNNVTATFSTQGNAVAGDGSLAGLATLEVNGSITSAAVTKTNVGDGLGRPIGIGTFTIANGIIELEGLIHNPSVQLVPEPAAAWLFLGAAGALAACRRNSRCR